MLFNSLVSALALAASATAIMVTAPTNTSGWQTSGGQLIQWTSVDTDPSNFTIQLYAPSSPNTPQLLAQTVQTSDGTYTYSPSSPLSVGGQYRINFVGSNGGILAQSNYFNVTDGTSTVSASSTSSASASSTSGSSASASASGALSSASAALSSASGAASSAAASPSASKAAANNLVAPGAGAGGLLLLLGGAIGVLA